MRTRTIAIEGIGPAFLLLHGYTDSADTWRHLLRELQKRGCTGLAIDLPSHGLADSVKPDRPALAQLVDLAEGAARVLGPDTIVVGNSLGGTVALLLAERDVPIGGVIAIGPGAFDHPRLLRFALSKPVLAVLDLVPPFLLMPSYALAAANARMERTAVPLYLSHLRSGPDQRRLRRLGRRLATEAVSPYTHERMRCPVGLVWGSEDRFATPSGARYLREAVPDLTYVPLEGVGHSPHHEVPETIADILTSFSAAHGAAPEA